MSEAPRVNLGKLLETANKIRLAIGIGEGKIEQLPKGKIGDTTQCVLARALSNGWKAEVESDNIQLRCPVKLRNKFDFDAGATALRQLGFKEVSITDVNRYTKEDVQADNDHKVKYGYRNEKLDKFVPAILSFATTANMANFIERFDDGDFPDLILETRGRKQAA